MVDDALIGQIQNAIGWEMLSEDREITTRHEDGVEMIVIDEADLVRVERAARRIVEELFGPESKKKIGYGVVTKGRVNTLEKLYTNFEDADKHYEWQANNPYALDVQMFRLNYSFLQPMKKRGEEEKPEHTGMFVEVEQDGDAAETGADSDAGVVDDEVPGEDADEPGAV